MIVKKDITIVIPTLLVDINSLQFCLLSLINQKLSKALIQSSVEVLIIANTKQQLMEQARQKIQVSLSNIVKPFIRFTWLCLGKNIGFTGAVNAGIKQAKGNYIILLNDDTIVDPNWLNELIKTQQDTSVDMVASKICLSDKKTLDSQGFGFSWRGKAEPLDKNLKTALTQKKDYWLNNPDLLPKTKLQEPFGPDAAAALYTKKLFDKIGYFDNDFFAYLEDVDLALRARQAGMCCVLANNAIVYHHKHATTKKQKKNFKAKQDLKNWWKIVCRSYPKKAWLKFAHIILLERLKNLSGYLKSSI